MPAIETVNTAAGALAAGLATSLHCAGMCAPVACSLMALKGTPEQQQQAAILYHTGRVLSYTTLGVLAGSLGRWPLEHLTNTPVMLLPWLLASVLLFMALGLKAKLPRPAFLKKWSARTRLGLCRVPLRRGAFALGMATPLLPCGPLYLMVGIALLSGSAVRGAEFMLAFSLGTIPLLWFAQHRFHIWRKQLGAVAMDRVKRAVCLAASVMLIIRVWPVAVRATADETPVAPSCLFCADDPK
jgi:sulfite exporter TauE/SafE